MRILVATDFSPRSHRAVRRAGILAGQSEGDVILMHVVDGAGAHQAARDIREAQRMIAEQVAVVPEFFRVECRSLVVAGRLSDAVLDAATARQADMIVIGSGHGTDARGPGRTVRGLIRAAPCPILVVNRSVVGPYTKVTVPIDLSDASARALRSIASLGLADHVRVTVVHAFEALGKPKLTGFGVSREQIDGYVESWRSLYAEEVDAFLEVHGPAARDWPTRVEEGRPEEVIAGLAARTSSELLVMGTHARTGIRRALLGSVTEAVLATGGADVLVVPPLRSGIGPDLEPFARTPPSALGVWFSAP
ncbi:universal stress protein [Methylobacterium sp. R2-1]|uniref:universal stress protein n=1 Tax=Methylobacterium sp. R2-1 TaxID=2587064 RepID=UPI00161EDC69|nr:universal stress protein [Methylobacterium sp. R2-1]MBB2960922.1 nucleotide-binding universal stress UspA family protein [Methylobacterium sp. R2-1]